MLVMTQTGQRCCVLVADDHLPLREGVRLVLEASGCRVVQAGTAEEAVVRARVHRPDVCLIDLSMPGGGLTAAHEIRAAHPDTAIVVLTGDDDEESVVGALEAGACGYLVKGRDDGLLLHAIETAARGLSALPHRYLSLVRGSRGQRSFTVGDRCVELTSREAEVMRLLQRGARTGEIATALRLAPPTVRRHISSALHKLGVSSRSEAIELADRSTDAA